MIQSCPSCGTLYRHGETRADLRARCGACDETFALAVRPPYRIVAMAPASASASRAASPGWTRGALALDPTAISVPAGATDLPPADLPASAPEARSAPEPSPWPPGPSPDAAVPGRAFDDVLLESDAGRTAASWTHVTGWAAAGMAAGVAGHLVLGGPVWIGAGVGAAAGCVAAWGQRQWAKPRS